MKTQKTAGFSTLVATVVLSATITLGCSYGYGSLRDEFDNIVVDIGDGIDTETRYVLGSRFELNRVGVDQATVEVSDSSVLGIERSDARTYFAEARSQGRVTLRLTDDGGTGTATVVVTQPDAIELAQPAVIVRGGLARAQLQFVADGRTLRGRDVITFAENAQAVLPERGQDELWVRGGDEDEMVVTLTVNDETFALPLTVVDVDVPVAQVAVQGLGQQRYEARVFSTTGERILGAEITWSLDGVDLPSVTDSPGDRYASYPGSGSEHELCARAAGFEGCLTVYQDSAPGIVD